MFPLSERHHPENSFAELGIETLVYVRPIEVNGRLVHIIHAADGTPLTVISNRKLAFATASQQNMNPLSVH